MKVKEGSEKVGLKLKKLKHSENYDHGIWSHHFMANRGTMETVADFIFLGSKITADVDCSHEIKSCLLLGKKSYDQLRQHIKKQRHYFPDKDLSNQSYDFSVVMCGCESWTIKKAKRLRIDAFELWCWRRFLRVPWSARRSNQ